MNIKTIKGKNYGFYQAAEAGRVVGRCPANGKFYTAADLACRAHGDYACLFTLTCWLLEHGRLPYSLEIAAQFPADWRGELAHCALLGMVRRER